jgi:predicted O-methyltransferase YrrM
MVGLVSWDESVLLYNYARTLQGEDLLEIGCWIGWSTVLLGLGGCRLTVIDPVLSGMPQGETCRAAVRQAGLADSVTLIGGFSPAAVEELTARGAAWSACFIDGNHEGDGPLRDAQASVRATRDDCLILFHDMILPNVAEGLTWLKGQGWNVGVHYTCWFLGVAWRGSKQPLEHTPDPGVDWDRIIRDDLPHLASFPRI